VTGLYFAVFHGDLIIAETGIPAFAVTIYYPIVFISEFKQRNSYNVMDVELKSSYNSTMHMKDTC